MNMFKRMAFVVALVHILMLAGCSSSPVLRAAPETPNASEVPSHLSPESANDVTVYAVGLVGTPYRYGGNTPDTGFDCSGLIGHVYQTSAAVVAPRTVSLLKNWGVPISGDRVRSGDLVLFALRDEPNHAGIYVGNGRFVHAPSTGGEVRLDSLNSKYWAAQNVTFRRP
jgi:cell wall-associated NlpC family hydrolase